MQHHFATTAFAVLFLLSVSASSHGLAMETERITSFDSTIRIQVDTSLAIEERITVLALGENIRHGIIRDIPATFEDDFGFGIRIRISVREALLDGEPVKVRKIRSDDAVSLVVGDENRHLAQGEHVFVLRYDVMRQLRYLSAYDALYWQVTGRNWGMPIDSVRAIVMLPEEGVPFRDSMAYTGSPGNTRPDVASWEERPGVMVFEATRPLSPDEGMFIALAWPKGLVDEPSANEYYRQDD